MDHGTVAMIFTFWATFFTTLTVKEFFFDENKATVLRLQQLFHPRDVEAPTETLALPGDHDSATARMIREKLLHAGLKSEMDLKRFLWFRKISLSLPLFVAILLHFLFHAPLNSVLATALVFGVVFTFLPVLWLRSRTNRRRREIKRHLPDAIDLFVVALDAGLSFDSALVRVGEEQRRISTHISRELLYTNQQVLVGTPREEALRQLAKRCGIEEMTSLVRAIIQSNRLGTSIVKTFRAQAESLRKKRRQEIHAQILKAPVKLIFPLLCCIFPILLIVILGPSLVAIFRQLDASAMTLG